MMTKETQEAYIKWQALRDACLVGKGYKYAPENESFVKTEDIRCTKDKPGCVECIKAGEVYNNLYWSKIVND